MINSRDFKDLLRWWQRRRPLLLPRAVLPESIYLSPAPIEITSPRTRSTPRAARRPGKRVTNAKGGQSMHNHRVAFDFVPIVNGKAMWDDARAFRRCGIIAQSLGLEWGGSWTSFPDLPHCQYTGGLTLAQLQAGKVPK